MKKTSWLIVIILLACAASRTQGVRKPVWAGQFYEQDKARLSAQIDAFLAAAAPAPVSGEIRVLIVPHAGYIYSGRVAAFGYKLVQGRDYETVVILGPSHHVAFEGASIWPDGAFETPLGSAAVDVEAARLLARSGGFRFSAEAHAEEHSVEVQVPWIQKCLPKARIVPVVMGVPSEATTRSMAAALTELAKTKKILVIASTDMSHFLSKTEANALDQETAEMVRTLKTDALARSAQRYDNRLCGIVPVLAALAYAQKEGPAKVDVLKYADSSEAGTPADRVVGYMAAAVWTPPVVGAGASRVGEAAALAALLASPAGLAPEEFALSPEEKKELLALARRTLEAFVRNGTVPPYDTSNVHFTDPRGAFVTLTKKGDLRGCIGYIEPVAPLFKAVQQCAVYAASEDPRFSPVTPRELADIAVEISVLTTPRKINDPRLVQVGKHGLILSRNGRRGVLLPQVATDNGWEREEFLSQACLKAGLPSDDWKKGAVIEVFEAIVFR
jgi:AmmeMemoRadiSam system protein B/AmmeMemoRadiSam system protein A